MRNHLKPNIALACGAMLLFGMLCQSANAESGTSILATQATTDPSEQLTIDWSVVENSGVYTYTYDVYNPSGDVLWPATDPAVPESFEDFYIGVNYSLVTSISDGGTDFGSHSIKWFLDPSIAPGSSTGDLVITSDYGPVMSSAKANDQNEPSPWNTTYAGGTPIPVPGAVPDTANTMILLGSTLVLLPLARLFRKSSVA